MLFFAGLALVRAHNRWVLDWPVMVTLSGWAALVLGSLRMVFPHAPQAEATLGTYVMLAGLCVWGLVLCWFGYRPRNEAADG